MDTNYIIETKNLTKQYGSQKSVADLNIHVKRGRIYGLLGRNGAGKTTTMKMLLGLTKPTSGEVKIWGKSLQGNEKKLLPRIGSLIESPGFYPNLTGTENLRIFATLRGVPNNHAIKDALDLVGLPYKDKKLFSQYSLGMKQRLAIALAVMHDPELLILDEPINGLDPIGIAVILDAQDTVTVNNDDRYPLMSVFKFHQALAVADYLDRNGLTPDTEIFIPEEELVPDTYSPLRKEFPEGEISLSVSRLLEYSLQLSDNNACDILFEHTGGPAATDRYVRSLGLRNFAIAATEQQMHDDPQTCYENWSTPLEAAALLELLVTEQILTPTLREMIRQNLINCKTGADRLPKPLSGTGAVIGHKTGTSDRDERGIFAGTNDPGFVILPDGTRYTIAVFIKDSAENPETNARIIADISETVYRYVHDEYRENDIRPGKKHVDQGAGIGFESDYFY